MCFRSFFHKMKSAFLDSYWSFDRRLLGFGSDVYFVVVFCFVLIVFLNVVVYVLLPVLFFLLRFLGQAIGGLL